MKHLWTMQEVAQATQGKGGSDWAATGVSIDSRKVQSGDIFIALKGAAFDGHDYVAQALASGAVAAIVSHVPQGVDVATLMLVADTEKALQDLGIAARKRSHARVIGVTGSIGKTGCKEMLKVALATAGKVHATSGNYNNHLGVPLTLATMPRDTEIAIFEMGMNHAGEISQLSKWVKPHVAVITTVEAAHIEFFENIDAIANAKAEIFDGMGGAGVAVLNIDNPQFLRLQKHAVTRDLDRVLSFGASDDALCQLVQYGIENVHSTVDAVIAGTRMQYRLGAIGKHWGLMSVAVLAVVDALEADLPKAAAALEFFSEPEGRGKISQMQVQGGYLRLIDDCYNASPASMVGAFEKMADLRDASPEPVRTIAVLGDMLELGERSRELHVGLAPTLVNNHIDLVFAAGEFMKQLYDALPESMRGDYDKTAAGLAPKVVGRLQHQDLVLIKGSNGSRMRDVKNAIEHNAQKLEERKDA